MKKVLITFSLIAFLFSCSDDETVVSNEEISQTENDEVVLKSGWINEIDFSQVPIDNSLIDKELENASNSEDGSIINKLPEATYHVYGNRSTHAQNLNIQFTSSRFGLPPGIYTYDAYKYVAAVQLPAGYEGKPYSETSCLPCGYSAFTSNPSTTKLGIVYETTSSNVLIMTTLVIHIKKQNGTWPIDVWTPFDAFDYNQVRFTYKIRLDDGWKN